MNRWIKTGLISLLGISSALYVHTYVENKMVKVALEAPIAITTLAGIYYSSRNSSSKTNLSVEHHQLLGQLRGSSGKEYHMNAGKVYRNRGEQ